MKYFYITVFIWWSVKLYGGDISDIEFKRMAYPHYEVSDIFGVAKLLTSIVTNSERLKELFKNPKDILRATLLVGSIAAMVRVSLLAVQGLSARLPDWTSKFFRRCISWCMHILNIPEGFDYDQLVMCEQIFEQVIWARCDPTVVHKQSVNHSAHWDYQRHFMQDVLHYLIKFLESHQCYYRAIQQKRSNLKIATHRQDNKIDQACFLVQSSIHSLRHLSLVIEQAVQPEHFDVEHVKKIARMTIIILKKLCVIIGGDSVQSYGIAENNFVGQTFLPVTSLFDV